MRTLNASSRSGHSTDLSAALAIRTSALGTEPVTSFQTVWHGRLFTWDGAKVTPGKSAGEVAHWRPDSAPQARRQRPHPGCPPWDAPGLDQDAGVLRSLRTPGRPISQSLEAGHRSDHPDTMP